MGHSCRECSNFHRVEDRNGEGRVGVFVQGFCILGQLQADFSLYYSTSASRQCGAFSRSEYNATTHDLERKLSKGMDDFKIKLMDRRTKECKAFEKCCPDEDTLKTFTGADENTRFHLLHLNEKLRETFKTMYLRIHDDEFMTLWKRHRLYRPKYYEIVHELTTGLKETMRSMCLEQYNHQDELWAPRVESKDIPIEQNGYA